jgi:DNA polymerase-3 subunit delta'
VIVVFEAERLNETAANKLLKTLEEPPPSAFLVLVTAGADQLLPTIRSRCQRVDFAHLSPATIERVLEDAGTEPARAALVARLAGGRLDRARALDGRLAPVRDAFVGATARLDGTGGAVAAAVDRVQDAMQSAMQELEAAQAEEIADVDAELSDAGYPDRVARAQLRRLAQQHKRAHRHARTELLLEGITAVESLYRDALAGSSAPLLNTDRPLLAVDARACGAALDACRAARRVLLEHNPNETLLLERLFLHLPGQQ